MRAERTGRHTRLRVTHLRGANLAVPSPAWRLA
jgi:hypothetical protein